MLCPGPGGRHGAPSHSHSCTMNAIISVCYYIVLLVWSLACFLVMLALFILTALFDRERVVLHVLSKVWARSIFRLNPLWKLMVTGKENVDKNTAYVVTVNHQSMLDIPLMYALPGINFKWVAKKAVYKWPLFGAVLWLHGDIVVSHGSVRHTKEFMDKGRAHLSRGTSVIIFPEGTRSRTGEMGKFREGAFSLAREAEVAVLPCVINGAKDFMKGWQMRKCVFEVRILPPVPAENVAAMPTKELMDAVRECTVAELAEMRAADEK